MQLVKFIVCISVLVTKICSAGSIMKTSKPEDSSLIETLIDILESCYADRFNTVGLAGPSIGNITTKMSLRETPIPVTMIDGATEIERRVPLDRGTGHKLQVFVITINVEGILPIYVQLWWSKWWNHMASFLFIDLNESGKGCSIAAEILLKAWNFYLLNSKFLCHHQTRGQLIYTFNPYTSMAPAPWHEEGTYPGINGHPWTLLVREYRENESYCNGLDFDKTIDLGGHEIRAVGRDMEKWWSPDSSFTPYLINRQRNITAQFLMDSLNATWKVTRVNGEDGQTKYRNATYNVAAEVYSRNQDISLELCADVVSFGSITTEVILESGVMFVTQYPGNKSQLEKLISVLDRSSRFGVLVVLMITLLFLKFWLGNPLIPSILDIVLLICNSGLHRIPRETGPRIYLTSLFIFVVTIQGIYSGVFASLLTKDVRQRTIHTLEDLARSDYTIYGAEHHRKYFYDEAFEGRYFLLPGYTCESNRLRDSKAACVNDYLVIIDEAVNRKMHASREYVGHVKLVYVIRPDWPLVDRVNKIFRNAWAGDLIKSRFRLETARMLRKLRSYENQEDEPEVKVLTLKQLTFAFVMLGIGLVFATVTFIIEVVTFGPTIANLRNRIRR